MAKRSSLDYFGQPNISLRSGHVPRVLAVVVALELDESDEDVVQGVLTDGVGLNGQTLPSTLLPHREDTRQGNGRGHLVVDVAEMALLYKQLIKF